MTASPYDMVAYRPAARSEFRATVTNFSTAAPPAPGRGSLRGDGCDRRAGLGVLRPDQVDLPSRLVLGDHEGEIRLPRLGEAQHLAWGDALLHLQPGERCADVVPRRL